MTWTQRQVEAVREGSCAEAEQGRHLVRLKERHQPRREAAHDANPTEEFCERQLMWHPRVPGRVLAVKELHAPGLGPAAQPAVLSRAFSGNGGVCHTELPVSLPGHVDLPVMATKAEAF